MSTAATASLRERVAATRWYHTLDLPGGVVTPGEYDIRPVVDRLPIPARLDGARCLDIGGRDGFYAFELERRGAAEVVSIDIDDPADIHFPGTRPDQEAIREELAAGNRAFELAREALGSNVERRYLSIYDLDPGDVGQFDFAVLGTLLLHLRDPVTALTAVRRVVKGRFLVNEPIIPAILPTLYRKPLGEPLMPLDGPFFWHCNPAGLKTLVRSAGFEVLESSRPYLLPYGPERVSGPIRRSLRRPFGEIPRRLINRAGLLHVWVLAAPANG